MTDLQQHRLRQFRRIRRRPEPERLDDGGEFFRSSLRHCNGFHRPVRPRQRNQCLTALEGVVAIHADLKGLSLARLVQDIRAQHVTPPGTDPEAPLLRAGNHQVEGRFPGREIEGFRR